MGHLDISSGISRRAALMGGGAAGLAVLWGSTALAAAGRQAVLVGPGDAAWPDVAAWDGLAREVGGALMKVASPWRSAAADPSGAATVRLFEELRNPYYIGDDPALTQTLGWTDAWTSRTSEYAVKARSAADVAAALRFARKHRVRLVVRGGAHSYMGNSNAPDSLMVWTKAMDAVEMHEGFVPHGSPPGTVPVPAVSVGAGATWGRVYDAVTTRGGRYVQGGGCMTVGVAGLVQGGGFGSFSKRYGTAAGSLIEAEVVTADGEIRVVNRYSDPELFWALKGGGGGTFGIVTRLTLLTHDLPENFGLVAVRIDAMSDEAFRRLVARFVDSYRDAFLNEHWGEQVTFGPRSRVTINMVFQGLTQAQAQAAWDPFLEQVRRDPDLSISGLQVAAFSARHFWDPAFLSSLPGVVAHDDRPGAEPGNLFWAQNRDEAGQVLHGYHSAWLPAALLEPTRRGDLVDALVAHSREWSTTLHFNKGLAGAEPSALARSADTATNPAVLDAFALLITAGEEAPAYPGIAGHEPDLAEGRSEAIAMRTAFQHAARLLPVTASYVSESDYFEPHWQIAHWGRNYSRLLASKRRYDPQDVFQVHHGVGGRA